MRSTTRPHNALAASLIAALGFSVAAERCFADPVAMISVVAQHGVGEGVPALAVALARPTDVAADSAGNIYVANRGRVRRIDSAGVITTLIGGLPPETATKAASGVVVGPNGVVFLADDTLHRICSVSADGTATPLAGNGEQGYGGDGGPGVSASLSSPSAVALGPEGSLYIADRGNNRIRKLAPGGTITTIAGTGERGADGDGGPATAARLDQPEDVAVDSAGNVFLVNAIAGVVRKVDVQGVITTVPLGEHVTAIDVGTDGDLYFARLGQVWRLATDGQTQLVAGIGGASGFSGDGGPATQAKFGWIGAIGTRPTGGVLITDHGNKRIRAVDSGGIVTTIAGNGTWALFGDGGSAVGASFYCADVAPAPDGRLFVADTTNHRIAFVTPQGIIDTYAGVGDYGFAGDGGTAEQAQLYSPGGAVTAADGTLYIADSANNRIRKVDPTGTITTIAGTGDEGFDGDGGPATAATLDLPVELALGGDGSLYFTDNGNRRVRKIDPAGMISTIAGDGGTANAAEGVAAASASIGFVAGIAVRPDGTVLLALDGDHRVKEVRADGTLWTVAGDGIDGLAGDGGPAASARLAYPQGIAVAPDGAIFIADSGNGRIRRVANGTIATLLQADGALPPLGTPGGLRISSDGQALYACDGRYRRVLRLDLEPGE